MSDLTKSIIEDLGAYRIEELLEAISIKAAEKTEVKVNCPEDAELVARGMLISNLSTEKALIICLDAKNKIISSKIVSEGTVNQVVIYIREIIKYALNENATGIIFAHNHPSGETDPSAADIRLTDTLKKACEAIDINFLDSLVIGSVNGNCFSFKANDII